MGHVGLKTGSLGKKLEKPCVHCRSHIFSPIITKLGQNVCLDEIWDKFEGGSCRVKKTRSLGQMLEKPFVCSRGHIFSQIIMKLGQHFCLEEMSDEYE